MPKAARASSATASRTFQAVRLHVSAMMAGIAGALYVPQVGIINPGEFAPANSIEVVIWTAVGGRGTLIGPIIGAILVNGGKTSSPALLPEYWLFALGGLFVARHAVPAQGHRRHAGSVSGQAQTKPNSRPSAARKMPPPGGEGVDAVKIQASRSERHDPRRRNPTASSISTASRSPSMASRRSTTCRSSSSPARCAPSSARTAPARRR
jgi:hypothetical protein